VGNAALQAQRLVDQNRGAIAGDVETQQQISQLAMLGANNKFISAGVDSVEKGYEYNMKVLGGVIENVLGELNGPLTNFGTAAGNTTQTLNRMDMGLRDFTNRIAGMATAMYSTDIFAAGLQSTANATLGNARTGLALGEKVISTAFGTEPRIGSSGLGLTGQQNAPVEPGAAFKGLDFYGENGLIDYFTGGMGTEFKNMVTSMNETKDEIAKNNEKVDETNNGIKTTNNLLNTVIQNQNKQTTAIQNQ
jgi:hypothetical protein